MLVIKEKNNSKKKNSKLFLENKGLFSNYFRDQFSVSQNKKQEKHLWQRKTVLCYYEQKTRCFSCFHLFSKDCFEK